MSEEESERGRRRRRKPEEARALILDAATKLLAERGPDAITAKDVADAAGVSRSLVLHYFGSYEELVEEVFRDHVREVRQDLLRRMAESEGGGPRAWIEHLFDALSHPLYGRLMSWSLLAKRIQGASFFARRERGLLQVGTFLEERYRRLHGEPPFTREDLDFAMLLTVSAAFGYTIGRAILWANLDKEATRDRDRWFARRLAQLLEESLTGGPIEAPMEAEKEASERS